MVADAPAGSFVRKTAGPANNLLPNVLASSVFSCMFVAVAVVLCNAYRGFHAEPSS